MKAGNLRNRVQLFIQITNEWGESFGRELVATIYADVEEKVGSIEDKNGAITLTETIEVVARYHPALTSDLVLGYKGRCYKITSLISSKRSRKTSIVAEVLRE